MLIKRQERKEGGITLVALIVTLIVLLILAGITIATLFGENGIIKKAQKAKDETEQAEKDEIEGIDRTEQDMSNVINGTESGEGEYGKAEVDKKADKPSTMNGKNPSETNPYIPKGFKPINTDTSKWDATEGPQVNKGLVISDGNSEFVFIPVASINDMVMCQTHGDNQTIEQKTLKCPECKTNTKLAGKLYATTIDATFNANLTGQTYTKDRGIREPVNLTHERYSDNSTRLKNETWTEDLYQNNFNDMVKCVAKNKGFYVGRYETSMNGAIAQSKVGQNPMSTGWWGMYENSKTYSKSNTSLGVTSEMIWGCQWDAMLRFILTTDDSSHVTATTNVGHDSSRPYKTGGTNYNDVYTGIVAYNDIAANIYDLEGNCYEWTQEASSTVVRVFRGGYMSYSVSPSKRELSNPTNSAIYYTSRLTLY